MDAQKAVAFGAVVPAGALVIDRVVAGGTAGLQIDAPDGTKINVRTVSSSQAGRWTVDVQKSPSLNALKPGVTDYEVKFK